MNQIEPQHAARASRCAVAPRGSYRKEVGGVLVGYGGHVPRGRDKVGGASLGNVNDVHGYSPEDFKAKQLAQTFKQYGVGAC